MVSETARHCRAYRYLRELIKGRVDAHEVVAVDPAFWATGDPNVAVLMESTCYHYGRPDTLAIWNVVIL